jgi:prefoldin subunit 5
MDQAALLTVLSGLYDKLVADVAERVLTRLGANVVTEDALDDLIEAWVENNLDLEDAAKEAIQNSDHLADLIRETVKNDLTFTVSVD